MNTINSNNKICAHCKHFIRAIAIGMGIRCSMDKNERGIPKLLPSFKHTCSKFEFKENNNHG